MGVRVIGPVISIKRTDVARVGATRLPSGGAAIGPEPAKGAVDRVEVSRVASAVSRCGGGGGDEFIYGTPYRAGSS